MAASLLHQGMHTLPAVAHHSRAGGGEFLSRAMHGQFAFHSGGWYALDMHQHALDLALGAISHCHLAISHGVVHWLDILALGALGWSRDWRQRLAGSPIGIVGEMNFGA